MKKTLPFVFLVISVLGCNKSGPDASSTTNSNTTNSNAAPAKITKLIDLPATIGKSKDEIKQMVNGTPKHEDPWLEYTLEDCELTFRFDKAKKASDATFKFKPIGFGDAMIFGTETAEQLATMAGVDIKGKSPKSTSELGDTYEQEIAGKKVDVSFSKVSGKFSMVMITLK